MTDLTTYDSACPRCDAVVTATVQDVDGAPAVTDVTGCPHAEDLAADLDFVNAVLDALRSS